MQRLRTPDALQRYVEEQIYVLECRDRYLQPNRRGYVEGRETPNPDYMELSDKDRMQMRLQCVSQLRGMLSHREAELRVRELEDHLQQLIQTIETRAPALLQGFGMGMPTSMQ